MPSPESSLGDAARSVVHRRCDPASGAGRPPRHRLRTAASALLGAALVVAACNSDGETDDAVDGGPGPTADDAVTTAQPPATSTTEPLDDRVVEVELADFAFEGLPGSVPAGTRLTITNSSDVELHKLSALPLPAGDDLLAEDLLTMPGDQLAEILRVRPATVPTAGPGGPQVEEVGDGTLTVPGRYLLICAVPVGLDPDDYLDQLQGDGRRPQVSGGGVPHFRLGMVSDLVVE